MPDDMRRINHDELMELLAKEYGLKLKTIRIHTRADSYAPGGWVWDAVGIIDEEKEAQKKH